MTSPNPPIGTQALRDELSELSKQQSQALQTAGYMKMDSAMAEQYDVRAKRIAEIIKLIAAR